MPIRLSLPTGSAPALRFPEALDGAGLLVGWSLEKRAPRRPIGFSYGDPGKSPATGYIDPVLLAGEGHLVTIAPTGAGKGLGCIVPALLRHEGPVIVIDPKGENVAITARRRREMGQQVIVLDPMRITDMPRGHFNPLDLIDVDSALAVDDAAMLAHALWAGPVSDKDRFWVGRSAHLLTGAILHVLADHRASGANLNTLRSVIGEAAGDPALLLERMKGSAHPEVRRTAAALGIRAPETLGGILAFAQESVDFLRGPLLQDVSCRSSFSLDDITSGAPLSIYLVLPPHMLESHGQLLRVWISVLMSAITRRRAKPAKPTLFVLDEAAQLGTLPQLRQALTLLRGYGVQTWSFWQDVSQLALLYPADWRTMVNNCRVLQCFGALNMHAARDMSELTGFGDARSVIDLKADEMILQLAGDEAVVARRPNYLADPPFSGQFDANPYYDRERTILPRPLAAVHFYQRPDPAAAAGAGAGAAPAEDPQRDDPEASREPDPLLASLLRKWRDG